MQPVRGLVLEVDDAGLLVGLGVRRFMGAAGWVRRHYESITIVSGALLMSLGVLLITGQFTRLFAPLAGRFTPSL